MPLGARSTTSGLRCIGTVLTVCKLVIRQVAREGTKKTVFTNFPDLCRAMNRSQEHCMAFLLAVRVQS